MHYASIAPVSSRPINEMSQAEILLELDQLVGPPDAAVVRLTPAQLHRYQQLIAAIELPDFDDLDTD